MSGKKIIEIDVILDEFLNVDGRVQMILFHGDANSDFFKGKVLPGGVDTQRKCENDEWTLSARYILEGVDDKGKVTRIFVQNDGKNIDGKMVTTPFFITDNPELKWLETGRFEGGISDMPGGVKITIWEK